MNNGDYSNMDRTLRIINIEKNDEKISMDCYCEKHKADYFRLVLDAKTYQTLYNSLNRRNIYYRKAKEYIKEMCLSGKILPTKIDIKWES